MMVCYSWLEIPQKKLFGVEYLDLSKNSNDYFHLEIYNH